MSTRDLTSGSSRATGELRDDLDVIEEECVSFIRSAVDHVGVDEVVVALRGGLDSTTTAALAVEALGRRSVNGLVLPSAASDDAKVDDAQRVAFELGIDFRTVNVQPVVDALTEAMRRDDWMKASGRPPNANDSSADGRAVGNATARARMMAAYFEANRHGRLVLGTNNRTELSLGYVTKYGDGGADILPLGDLYETEVRRLAEHLDVPEEIIDRRPTAGHWEAEIDATELGTSYETIDAILQRLLDAGYSIERTAAELGVEEDLVVRFAELYRDAAHKRATPPTPETYVG